MEVSYLICIGIYRYKVTVRRRCHAHYSSEVASYFFPVRLRHRTTLSPTNPGPPLSTFRPLITTLTIIRLNDHRRLFLSCCSERDYLSPKYILYIYSFNVCIPMIARACCSSFFFTRATVSNGLIPRLVAIDT